MQGQRATPDARMQLGNALTQAGVMGWLPLAFQNTVKEYFAYTTSFEPLPASLTQSRNINIQSDTDFIILYATMVVTTADNLTPLPFAPALVQLRDGGDAADLFQTPTHVEMVFGDAMQPGIFSVPYILTRNSSLQVTLQNLEANDRIYRLAFHGFRSWPNSNQNTGKL